MEIHILAFLCCFLLLVHPVDGGNQYSEPICHLLSCAAFRKVVQIFVVGIAAHDHETILPFEGNSKIHNSSYSPDVQQNIVQACVPSSMVVCSLHNNFLFLIREESVDLQWVYMRSKNIIVACPGLEG